MKVSEIYVLGLKKICFPEDILSLQLKKRRIRSYRTGEEAGL
jgi:hypothetical protein